MKDIERMVISAHADGEVEAPWKDRVEARIAADPVWAAEASLHAGVKAALAADPEPDFTAATARVRDRIGAPARRTPLVVPRAWMTAAAAALVILAAGGGFWMGRSSAGSGPTAVAAAPVAAAEAADLKVQAPKQLGLKLSGEGQLLLASTFEGVDR